MGAYLSEPMKEKTSEEGESDLFTFAATSMQGWRVNQEDAHNAITDYADKASLFAVYDGHGGPEVSEYVSQRFPSFLKEQAAWRDGRIGEALTNGFLDFDAHLKSPDAVAELKRIAGTEDPEDGADREETADEQRMLMEEANLPIKALFEKYGILGKIAGVEQGESTFVSPHTGRRARKTRNSKETGTLDAKVEEKTSSDKEEAPSSEKRKKTNGSAEGEELAPKRPKVEDAKNGSETSPMKSPIGSPHRQRNSKSESEVRVLRAEEEAAGPISNWSAMGVKGSNSGGRETPDTATAASSGDEEEKGEEESEEDETYIAPEVEAEDEDADTDASSTQDDDDEDEEEEDEEMGDDEGDEFDLPSGDSPGVDSGTTACVAVFTGTSLYVANAGDSRCVLSRAGKAVDLSEDHKPEDEIEKNRIEAAGGKITPDGRVNGGLNLSRALGDHFYKRTPGIPLAKQMISPLPDIRVEAITPDDRFFVIACDGIWNSMESQEVIDFVSTRMEKGMKLKDIAEAMCDFCLAPDSSGDGTGCDNMTVIICGLKGKATANSATNGDVVVNGDA